MIRRPGINVEYDPDTGNMFYIEDGGPRVRASETLSKATDDGYRNVWINGKRIKQHRLAWYLVHGRWPLEVDHINGVRHDNRLCNLREVNRRTNTMNTKTRKDSRSGIKGVHWSKRDSLWIVTINHNRERVYLGCYKSLLDAASACKRAEIKYRYHENHGRYARD